MGQTPQAFKRSTIKRAYELALKDLDFQTTDDCGVVYRYLPEEFVYVVKGEQFNMKLTYKEDMFLLDKLFQLKSIAQQNETVTPKTIAALLHRLLLFLAEAMGLGLILSIFVASTGRISILSAVQRMEWMSPIRL